MYVSDLSQQQRPDPKRAVLISATSSGIGAACAKFLAQQGYWVFAGIRNLDKGKALQQETGENLVPILLDVTVQNTINSAVEQVTKLLDKKGIELLGIVNNACYEYHGPLELVPIEFARKEMEVSYLGYLAVTQTFLPLLRQSKGRIINFSSINGRCVFPSVGTGCAAKYAVEAMSDALRLELAPWGIRVSLIEPGAVATPLWEKTQQAFEDLPNHVAPEKLELYYPSWSKAVEKSRAETNYWYKRGMPPEQVVRAICHALTSNRPKTRYLIGTDAKIIAFLKWLMPDWLFASMAMRMFNYQD